jgi:nucleoside diphosphate kinase
MEFENTIYIIKPEAVKYSEKIRDSICDLGLKIVSNKLIKLPIDLVSKLYVDSPKMIIEATKHFMFNDYCEVGLVMGVDAIFKLKEKCGYSTNPAECENLTIRKVFGNPIPRHFNGVIYFQNAIHCPKTREEAKKDIELLSPIFFESNLEMVQDLNSKTTHHW